MYNKARQRLVRVHVRVSWCVCSCACFCVFSFLSHVWFRKILKIAALALDVFFHETAPCGSDKWVARMPGTIALPCRPCGMRNAEADLHHPSVRRVRLRRWSRQFASTIVMSSLANITPRTNMERITHLCRLQGQPCVRAVGKRETMELQNVDDSLIRKPSRYPLDFLTFSLTSQNYEDSIIN